MKYFLDTNIFLRYFTDEHQNKIYKECTELIKLIKFNKINATTSHLVIAEVVWTLQSSYQATKEQVVKVLQLIESLGLTYLESVNSGVANELFKTKSVKYIDVLIASNPLVQSKKMVIVSYDKDFDKLGVVREEPSEVIL